MSERRKQFGATLKAKVVVEALKGARTVNELAGLYQVHPTQIAMWKKRALDGLPGLFADGRQKPPRDDEVLQAQLYQQIGRLKVELDFLKKKVGMLG
jgi:transposase-like protein